MAAATYKILMITASQWQTWAASNVLGSGRLAVVVDPAEVTTQDNLTAIERDYTRALEVWVGHPDGYNVRLFAHEDIAGHFNMLHATEIRSFNENSPDPDATPYTEFASAMRFDYDKAAAFVKYVLGIEGVLTFDDRVGIQDAVDTRGRLPIARIEFQDDNRMHVSDNSMFNKSTLVPGERVTTDIASRESHRFALYNPVTGGVFIGHSRGDVYRSQTYIGVPFRFTRNSVDYPVPVWDVPFSSSLLQYSDGKPVIFAITDVGATHTLNLLSDQHESSFDLTSSFQTDDEIAIIDPITKRWRTLSITSVSTDSITVLEELENPFNEDVYLNVWHDVEVLNNDGTTDIVRVEAGLVANDVQGPDDVVNDSRTITIDGTEFPRAYKVVGHIEVHDVNSTGFDFSDTATTWLGIESDQVTHIKTVSGFLSGSAEDIARSRAAYNDTNVSYEALSAGISLGRHYIVPLSDHEVVSRLSNVPALEITRITRNNQFLDIGFANPVDLDTFKMWLSAFDTSINQATDRMYFAVVQRAAVVETGGLRGRNQRVVNGETIDNLIYSRGLRITSEPDQPEINHTPNANHTSAWDDDIDPTSLDKTDRKPDVINPRDPGVFEMIRVNQLGSAETNESPVGPLRSLRAREVLGNSPISIFESNTASIGDGDNEATGIACVTSSVQFDSTPLAGAVDRSTDQAFASNVDVYEIRLSSDDNPDPYQRLSLPQAGIRTHHVSTDEIVNVRIPPSFATQSMTDRHGGDTTGIDVYRITLVNTRIGWSFLLMASDLGRLNAPNIGTRLIIEGLPYNPQSNQTQFPQSNIGDKPIITTYAQVGYTIKDSSGAISLFDTDRVSESGVDPDKRMITPLDSLGSIPNWCVMYRVTCIDADQDRVRGYLTHYAIEPVFARSLLPSA